MTDKVPMTDEDVASTVVDPVCGMEVNPRTAAAKSCYNGLELYFCTQACKNKFDAAPQDYVLRKHKGFWRRYLERLNKATGGRPPSCHF
jgi:YHS domain-containing protein